MNCAGFNLNILFNGPEFSSHQISQADISQRKIKRFSRTIRLAFRTLFFFETSLKKKDVIVKTVETSSQTGIVEMFEKHWQCHETLREIS